MADYAVDFGAEGLHGEGLPSEAYLGVGVLDGVGGAAGCVRDAGDEGLLVELRGEGWGYGWFGVVEVDFECGHCWGLLV